MQAIYKKKKKIEYWILSFRNEILEVVSSIDESNFESKHLDFDRSSKSKEWREIHQDAKYESRWCQVQQPLCQLRYSIDTNVLIHRITASTASSETTCPPIRVAIVPAAIFLCDIESTAELEKDDRNWEIEENQGNQGRW